MPNILEPNDEHNEPNKEVKLEQSTNELAELSMEKQFSHLIFLKQVDTIDLASAKELLGQLHLLYLNQQVFLVKWAKQEFLGSL